MAEQNKRISYRIARRAGQQGARPSVADQAEVEKLATVPATPTSRVELTGHCTEASTQCSPSTTSSTYIAGSSQRLRWTNQQYREVIWCYTYIAHHPTRLEGCI